MARVPPDDWRRTGQENYLMGLVFKRMPWATVDPNWDHAHCAFCWRKFASADVPDAIGEGYGTLDLYHWVCPECFEDFREEFGWTVVRHAAASPHN